MGSVGIWISWPVGWTVAGVISFVFYRKGVWRIKPEPQPEELLEAIDEAEETAESEIIV